MGQVQEKYICNPHAPCIRMEYLHTFTINLSQMQVDIPVPWSVWVRLKVATILVDPLFFRFHEHHSWSTTPPVKYPPKKSRFNNRPYGGKLMVNKP